MSRSAMPAEHLSLLAPGQSVTFDPPGPCRYVVSRDDSGNWHQTEEFVDLSGDVVYRDSVPVHFAVGSGQRGYSFVTDRDGPMTMGVATWYSTRQKWDLSPGYHFKKHARFGRRVADGCVTCHFGQINAIAGSPNQFGKPPFPEMSIGCERCHGPGEDHVRYHTSSDTSTQPDPIVNPERLDVAEQLSVCYQCHLHGESRIVQAGRSEYDFRPGERLTDVWVTFVRGSGISGGTTTAVSQVEQMHASRCFIASDGQMTCTSCHDPHRIPSAAEKPEFYRNSCLSCHSSATTLCSIPEADRRKQSAADSCIDCHMPRLPAEDVPHTSQTDHRVVRRPEDAGPRPSATPELFAPELFPVSAEDQNRARALMLAKRAEDSGSAVLASSTLPLLISAAKSTQTDVAVYDAIGTCFAMVGDYESSHQWLLKALRVSPDDEHVLRSLVVCSERLGQTDQALRYLDRVRRLNPTDGLVFAQRIRLRMLRGDERGAIEDAKTAVQLMPDEPSYRKLIADLATAVGDHALADEHRSILERITQAKKAAESQTEIPQSQSSSAENPR